MNQPIEWIFVGSKEEVLSGAFRRVHTGERWVSLHLFKDQLYAIDDSCPHRGASLAEASIDAEGYLECWHHNWEFQIETGQGRHSFMSCVARFWVKEQEGEIFISRAPITGSR